MRPKNGRKDVENVENENGLSDTRGVLTILRLIASIAIALSVTACGTGRVHEGTCEVCGGSGICQVCEGHDEDCPSCMGAGFCASCTGTGRKGARPTKVTVIDGPPAEGDVREG